MIRLAVALALLAPSVQADCRQALALGLDVSGSVDVAEYRQQRDGLASALNAPEVRAALLSEPAAPVALAVFEWSAPAAQTLIQPWIDITDAASLDAVIAGLLAGQRGPADPSTAVGNAMIYGGALLAQRPDCARLTLDLSGDGPSNTGPRPQDVTDLPAGITINGLTVGAAGAHSTDRRQEDIKELSSYYRAYVIRGADAFVETSIGFDSYQAAMRRKLMRELQVIVVGSADPAPGGWSVDIADLIRPIAFDPAQGGRDLVHPVHIDKSPALQSVGVGGEEFGHRVAHPPPLFGQAHAD